MPIANVRGANINYEVLGTSGPWVSLSPGGRRALDHVLSGRGLEHGRHLLG